MTSAEQSHEGTAVFSARVRSRLGGGVVLDHTLFVAESTERASDTGLLDGIAVVRVDRLADGSVLHVTRGEVPSAIRPGVVVNGSVDLARRGQLSRMHSALHLAYLGATEAVGPLQRRSRRVEPLSAILEVEAIERTGANLTSEFLSQFMQSAISDDLPITVLQGGGPGARCYWHVDGLGSVACLGSHPNSTGQIGAVHASVQALDEGRWLVAAHGR